ncbi:MAG: endolytic transglycosylase MltG [Bacteroidia bacterium]|nr:endolytic transglycosylase MltG [Bacteroidia bacterium]
MPRKRRTRKTSTSFQWSHILQSQRFRRIAAGLLLLGIVAGILQFTAPIRLREPLIWRIPLDKQTRDTHRKQLQALFPWYTIWYWLALFTPLRPGHYELRPGDNCMHVWNRLRKGLQTPIRFYLRPHRSPGQLAAALGQVLAYDSSTWMATFRHFPWEEKGFNSYTWPLLFLPDVYEVYWTISPQRLIEKMEDNYHRFWNEERQKKAYALGLTPIEIGILASIVEQESYRVSERPLIASVYLNRLRLGMPLQADPTVIYAWGNFSVNRVTHKMLEIDSPYNTYKRRGLPPGPVGIPSIESIEAVLNYTPSAYLYFCARPDGSGYHDFSESYQEHLRKARSYQRALERWLAQKK